MNNKLVFVSFALIAAVVPAMYFAGKRNVATAPTTAAVSGATAGRDQAVDGGQGQVIVSAEFERAKSGAAEVFFSLSLNTHTVDLTGFDPAGSVVLRPSSGDELPVQTAQQVGERSSHHQNYTVSFGRPAVGRVSLVVRGVAGVPERTLPFEL